MCPPSEDKKYLSDRIHETKQEIYEQQERKVRDMIGDKEGCTVSINEVAKECSPKEMTLTERIVQLEDFRIRASDKLREFEETIVYLRNRIGI